MRAARVVSETPCVAGDVDGRVVLAVGEQRAGLVRGEQRAEEAAGVEGDLVDADDGRVDHVGVRQHHLDVITDVDVVLAGRGVVDDDLVGLFRRMAAGQLGRFLHRVAARPLAAGAGRAARVDALAVRVDEHDVRLHLRLHGPHPGHLLDDRDRRGRHPGREVLGRLHPRVDAPVAGGEDRVEALLERVGEDERAGHERGAEQHRDHASGRAGPCGSSRLRTETVRIATHAVSRRFMRSSTASAVGERSSSTMRPSARNSTRSA